MNPITKNVFSVGLGQGLSLVLNFFAITLAARHLGVENFGLFSYLLAIVGIVSKVIDLGFSPIVFREISKNPNQFSLWNTAINIRILAALSVFIIFNIGIYFYGFSSLEIFLVNILLINIFLSSKFQNLRELFDIPFKSHLMMNIPMSVMVFDNILFLVSVIVMRTLDKGIEFFVLFYMLSNIPGFIAMFFFVKSKFKIKFTRRLDKKDWLFKQSFPLYIFILLISIFQQLDNILLKQLDSLSAAGIYSAAARLTMPLPFLVSPILITAFPLIVKNLKEQKGKNDTITIIVYKFLFVLSFSIACLISFKAKSIILLVFGEQYSSSYLPLIYLLWAQVFLFFNFFSLDLLTALGKQKYISYYALVMVIVNSMLLVFLIPGFSFTGAAIAKISTSFVGTIFLIFILRRTDVLFNYAGIRLFIWGIVSVIALYFISSLSLGFYLVSGFFTVLVLLAVTKSFNVHEIEIFLKLFNLNKLAVRLKK